jgi:hypothetical protein
LKKKILSVILLFVLSIIFTPIIVYADENSTFPSSGFNGFINDINTFTIPTTTSYFIDGHNGMKTYMSYTKITDTTSKQYALQQIAYTDEMGFRKIDDRYCVAIGTAFETSIGQIFDAKLENGTIIKCIVGDIKDDKDTDNNNIFTSQGCCLEFIIDNAQLDGTIKTLGNCSVRDETWNYPCLQYIVYDINYLEKGVGK